MNEYNVINSPKIKGSDWNANEGENGYIRNRTHYTETVEDNIEWTFNLPENAGTQYYDNNPDSNLIDKIYNVFLADKDNNTRSTSPFLHEPILINGIESDCYFFHYKDNNVARLMLYSSDEITDPNAAYLMVAKPLSAYSSANLQIVYVSSKFTVGENTIKLSHTTENVVKIDSKYLPEMKSLSNIKDAENGGVIEGLVNEEAGQINVASGKYAHAEGGGYEIDEDGRYIYHPTFSSGISSHAEGISTVASGRASHAEGSGTTAIGSDSHTEGENTIASGANSHAEGVETAASKAGSHAEGGGTTASGKSSHAEGYRTTASGETSHAEGSGTTASEQGSHAEGQGTTASGQGSHAEGAGTTASGQCSHAEGVGTKASGNPSHAEGQSTTASGSYSHAEGASTTASGSYSHAEGASTTASGSYSHAEGNWSIANHKSQHVFGEYNIEDSSTTNETVRGNYIEIVGNGDVKTRSNARTLDWSGNEWISGFMRAENGFILKSPDGSLFTLTVANDGTLTATKNV